MSDLQPRLTKRETLPVADADGNVLGSCTIRKFMRQVGEAYNEIMLHDRADRPVADIRGYRLHSRICCSAYEGNCPRIDSKDAVSVARVALAHAGEPEDMLEAIQRIAAVLAEQRQPRNQGVRGRRAKR